MRKVSALRATRYRNVEVLTPIDANLVSIAPSPAKKVTSAIRFVVVMLERRYRVSSACSQGGALLDPEPMPCVIH